MAKQSKSKKPDHIGKGKVTPVQIAFIVDRYLSDNNFTQTRSLFRTEASSLMPKTQSPEAPKSLMSLGAIVDEYICLKEQKGILEQERERVDKEKVRVESLLKGMTDVMNVYNASAGDVSPLLSGLSSATPSTSAAMVPQSMANVKSPPGYTVSKTPLNKIHSTNSLPWVSNTSVEHTNYSTPSSSLPSQNKRRGSRVASDAPPYAKRACRQVDPKALPVEGSRVPLQAQSTMNTRANVMQYSPSIQSASYNYLPTDSSVHQSFVGKCLFKQPSPSIQESSPSPKTPPQAITSQGEKSTSLVEASNLVNSTSSITPKDMTPTNCPVIPSKAVVVSPSKHIAYYSMERSHYISCSSPMKTNTKKAGTRDHVKGRLDFGASDTSLSSEKPMTAEIPIPGPPGEANAFDTDFPDLDFLGDYSLSELLVDINFDTESLSSASDVSGSPYESGFGSSEGHQFLTEVPLSVTEILCEKNMNIQGSDSLSSMKSITKCITITSPVKNRSSTSMDQENQLTRN